MKGKMKDAYGSRIDGIFEMCSREQGANMDDLKAKLERTSGALLALMNTPMKDGRIQRVGNRPHSRYFTNSEHAEAYRLTLPAVIKAYTELKHQKHLEWVREYEHAKRKARGPRTRNRKKAVESVETIRQTKPYTPPKKKTTQVIWPENVKVTVAPTPKDTRFTFEPPKGWKGQITKDWMDRRLSGTEA